MMPPIAAQRNRNAQQLLRWNKNTMTMQMPRDPLSKAYPAAQCISILSADGAAEAVNRAPSTIRDWADPSRDACPNQRQELALDKACLAHCGVAPYADWYRRNSLFEKNEDPGTFLARLLQVGAAVGGLMKMAHEIEGIETLNAEQRQKLHEVYGGMRKASTDLESCITQLQMRDPLGEA